MNNMIYISYGWGKTWDLYKSWYKIFDREERRMKNPNTTRIDPPHCLLNRTYIQ